MVSLLLVCKTGQFWIYIFVKLLIVYSIFLLSHILHDIMFIYGI